MRINQTNLVEWLPSFYDGIREANVLVGIENVLFDRLKEHMQEALDNQFIKTCSIEVIEAWERIFDIVYDPSFETEQFRRERIINRLSNRQAFTLRFLIERLNFILGTGNFAVYIDHDNYTLYIETAAENRQSYNEAAQMVHRIKPANMVYISVPVSQNKASIACEAFVSKMILTRLGSWQLGVTAFRSQGDFEGVEIW